MSTPSVTTVDDLDPKSREFYERSRFKLALSLILAAVAMMMLGFCASSGAEAQVDLLLAGKNTIPDYYRVMMTNEGGSQGFACFAYLAGFLVAFVIALYVSPLLGSENEKRMLSNPSNITEGGAPAIPVDPSVEAPAEN